MGVWSVSYPTLISSWQGRKLDIPSLANTVAHGLLAKGLSDRPLIFIGHSMGGLLIKEMLAAGRMPGGAGARLQAACAAVVFYGTPHDGADLPEKLTQWTSVQGTHIEELKRGAPRLQWLITAFGYWVKTMLPRCEVTAYCETQPIAGVLVVDKSSADPGLGELVSVIDLPYDHIKLCKRSNKNNIRFDYVVSLVNRIRANRWSVRRATDIPVLVSYAWGDLESAKQSSRLVSDLALVGIPVLSDWDYRDRGDTPVEGWSVWRSQVIKQAVKVIIIGGERYREINQNGPNSGSSFEGIILSNEELQAKGVASWLPLLPEGLPEHLREEDCLPPEVRKEKYKGRRIPASTPMVIQQLCGQVSPTSRGFS